MNSSKKRYSLGEEIFNSVFHGLAAGLAVAGTVILIVFSAIYQNAWAVVSASVYGSSLIILYTMSTLYHALPKFNAKKVFRVLDHNAIFFVIAGTYTPYTLVVLRGALGWTLFAVVWVAAIVGIVLNSVNLEKFRIFSLISYFSMGWVILIAIKPLSQSLSTFSLVLLFVGGALYTLGAIFYALRKHKYMISLWAMFVVAGSVLHYLSIFSAITKH